MSITPDDARRLMAALVELSPYRRPLRPLLGDLTRIALANHQLHAALEGLSTRLPAGGAKLTRADLGADAPLFADFLEYMRFASPAFLASVGEWPIGGARG
ncbi:hypothetical protein [Xanthobacter variabilis]|uniref:hypothetical protein n=1 Tax=Xanthobacter variabilis TaxID=3119932 RepID=UPI003726F0CC